MFDNTNPYTLRTEVVQGILRYFVSFQDGQAILHDVEVSSVVFAELERAAKKVRNLRRWDERHTEQSELTDETLHGRAVNPLKSVEDAVLDGLLAQQLKEAIQSLPKIQRRRFVLYHDYGLTYEQIAQAEGCTFQAVAKSIKIAGTSIKKHFENSG